MKSVIPSLTILFIFINSAFSQTDFKVIKVNGSIVLKTKGISLETGTVFSDKEDLLFRSEDATAAVINSQKGRIILTRKNHDLSTASANSLPAMYNISSRSMTNKDLSDYFSGKCVVLDRLEIEVDNNSFPMDKDHFFFLRYTFNGEEINKKLSFTNDTLIIDKKSLLTIDGNPIPRPDNTSITLYYRKDTGSVQISEFDLIFPDMKQLSKEIKIILDEINAKTYKEKVNETGSYINEFYGKVYRENLTSWLKTNFGLTTE